MNKSTTNVQQQQQEEGQDDWWTWSSKLAKAKKMPTVKREKGKLVQNIDGDNDDSEDWVPGGDDDWYEESPKKRGAAGTQTYKRETPLSTFDERSSPADSSTSVSEEIKIKVINYMVENPFTTQTHAAKKFQLTPRQVGAIWRRACVRRPRPADVRQDHPR